MIGSFNTTKYPLTHHVFCRDFGETSNHPGDSAPLQSRSGTLPLLTFPNLKSPLKGKRLQTIAEIQENMTGKLMATGRTV